MKKILFTFLLITSLRAYSGEAFKNQLISKARRGKDSTFNLIVAANVNSASEDCKRQIVQIRADQREWRDDCKRKCCKGLGFVALLGAVFMRKRAINYILNSQSPEE